MTMSEQHMFHVCGDYLHERSGDWLKSVPREQENNNTIVTWKKSKISQASALSDSNPFLLAV